MAWANVPALVFQAADAALMQMPRLAQMPQAGLQVQVNALIAQAVTEMFSYDTARLRQADALLAEAGQMLPSGRIDAFRSLVRQIMFVERTEGPPSRLEAEADAFARSALEQANGNPLVLALVSYTRVMIDANPEAGTILAGDAVRLCALQPLMAIGPRQGPAFRMGAMMMPWRPPAKVPRLPRARLSAIRGNRWQAWPPRAEGR